MRSRSSVRLLILSILAACVSGCYVQSISPCYTEESKAGAPSLEGKWKPTYLGKDESVDDVPAWEVDGDDWRAFDSKKLESKLKCVVFKAGGQTFLDVMAGDPPTGKVSEYWLCHVRPVHSVVKVTLKDNELQLTPLDCKWMDKQAADGKVKLPRLPAEKDTLPLYTASPKEWVAFLTQWGADPEAFKEAAVKLRKQ